MADSEITQVALFMLLSGKNRRMRINQKIVNLTFLHYSFLEGSGTSNKKEKCERMEEKTNVLVLIRHGQSEYNQLNLFTGWRNPPLTNKGQLEAKEAGEKIKKTGVKFDYHFTSNLIRAQKTGQIILEVLGQSHVKTSCDEALNERNYGDLAGLNKDEARKKWGDEQVHIWRRSFDIAPPGGESLKDTFDRTVPFFEAKIKPHFDNKNILVSAHGNTIRALVMHIEDIDQKDIVKLEIATGVPIFFKRDGRGRIIKF